VSLKRQIARAQKKPVHVDAHLMICQLAFDVAEVGTTQVLNLVRLFRQGELGVRRLQTRRGAARTSRHHNGTGSRAIDHGRDWNDTQGERKPQLSDEAGFGGPNRLWRGCDVEPNACRLNLRLGLPLIVANDVRAATERRK
jgi:hypothetical protein